MSGTSTRRSTTFKAWIAVVGSSVVVLVVVGSFWLTGRTSDLATPDPTTTTATTNPPLVSVPDDCPATTPDGSFVPPDGFPATAADPNKIWYGTEDLWTALPTNGISDFEKSVWWSANFLGPADESKPEIEVEFRLLGEELEPIVNSNATTGRTPDDGIFISVGFQPDFQGCWEVTASYKGATLSYVYYASEGRSLRIEVPDLVGWTVREAFNEFDGEELVVTFATDPGDFEATSKALGTEICDQTPHAGESVARGTTVLVAIPDDDGTCPDLNITVEVPELVGLTIDLATLRVRDLGLSTLVYGSSGTTSVVCSQEPGPGELINAGEGVTVQAVAPGGCEEMLNPNGLYSRTYVNEAGFELFGTDCPAADVLIRGGRGDGLPHAGDTTRERVDRLLQESGSELAQPGVISFETLPRSGKVWDSAENGEVVVFDSEDDYMIKVTVDASFGCPDEPYFWNGIPVAYVLAETE